MHELTEKEMESVAGGGYIADTAGEWGAIGTVVGSVESERQGCNFLTGISDCWPCRGPEIGGESPFGSKMQAAFIV